MGGRGLSSELSASNIRSPDPEHVRRSHVWPGNIPIAGKTDVFTKGDTKSNLMFDTHTRFGAGVLHQWLTYSGGSMNGKALGIRSILSLSPPQKGALPYSILNITSLNAYAKHVMGQLTIVEPSRQVSPAVMSSCPLRSRCCPSIWPGHHVWNLGGRQCLARSPGRSWQSHRPDPWP